MGLLNDIKSNDKRGLFTSNDNFINYSTGILPLDYANGFWQEVTDDKTGEKYYEPIVGIIGGTFISIVGSTGTGKSIPNNTLLHVPVCDKFPKGECYAHQIAVGDYLFDKDGNTTKVLGVFPQGKKPVYQLTFDDGRTAKCSPDHLWTVADEQADNDKFSSGDRYIRYIGMRCIDNDFVKVFNEYITVSYLPMADSIIYYNDGINNIRMIESTLNNDDCKLEFLRKIFKVKKTSEYISGYVIAHSKEFAIKICKMVESLNRNIYIINYYGINDTDLFVINVTYDIPCEYVVRTTSELMSTMEDDRYRLPPIKAVKFKDDNSIMNKFVEDYKNQWFEDGHQYGYASNMEYKIDRLILQGTLDVRKQLINDIFPGIFESKTGVIIKEVTGINFANDIVNLIRSCGYKANLVNLPNNVESKQRKFAITCIIPRLTSTFDNGTAILKRDNDPLYITDIKDLGYEEEQVCFYVDNPDHIFLTENFIPTHNTTLADQIGFNIIKDFEDGLLTHVDAERTALRQRMIRVMGTNMDDERISIKKENTSVEDVLEMIDMICKAKESGGNAYKYQPPIHSYNGKNYKVYIPTVIIIDSVVSFNSKEYSVEDLGTNMDGARSAKVLTRFVNNCLDRMQKYNITVIMVSHIRSKVDVNPYASAPPGLMLLKPGESVPGGINLQYMCQNFFRINMVKSNAYTVEDVGFNGFKASVQIAKSKTNFIGAAIDVAFNKDIGFDPVYSLLEFANSAGIIQGRNPYLYFQGLDTMKFNRKDFRRKFMEEKAFRDSVMEILQPHFEALLGIKEVTTDDKNRFGDLIYADPDMIQDNTLKKTAKKMKEVKEE